MSNSVVKIHVYSDRMSLIISQLRHIQDLITSEKMIDFVTFANKLYKLLVEFFCSAYWRQVLEGVRYVHSKQIVHRDLKPENILLDDQLNVKITDFGFAKVLRPDEKLFELCGTPGYLAPETLKANMFDDAPGYGIEVDVWACGVIMFTLLVGCPPFWHRKQMVMLRNIMEGKYSFTSPEWADISEAPKDLIRKFLVVEPRDRISIDEALRHPFFNTVLWDQDMTPLKKSLSMTGRRMSRIDQLMQIKSSAFNPRAKLRLGLLAVRAAVRLRRLPHTAARTVALHTAQIDPYTMRVLRKVIDGCAFRVYGHWVKKGEGQNRAALFENTPKTELKSLYVSNLSR